MLRGLDKSHEQDPRKLLRDTRTLGQRFADFFKNPLYSALTFAFVAIVCVFFPQLADLILVVMAILFIYSFIMGKRATLPFRMPLSAKAKDYNDPLPGVKAKARMARGISFYGNDRFTNEELWFNNDDLRTHTLIFGSTGSGKTETLVSLAFNALVQGSGFIYVDGKGDNSLFAKVFSMARRMGREDDMLTINFMTGARDVIGAQESRLSNTMNPFAAGSSSMLTQLVVSLMGESSQGSGDGDMWKGRAINFVESLMKILVYMRDKGDILLDANTIRNYFHLGRLESITMDKVFPRDEGKESVSIADVPDIVIEPITNYVLNLPGYNKDKKGKQVSQVLEQHGFITMQLTRSLGSFADAYGHIMRTNLAEVDMKDVVLNRRILVVLLPALEKSPEELSNLGKIIIATLKAMMAAGLGDRIEGDFKDVITRKPTNSPTPYVCILDEYGYYAVKGFAVVPAQARSLGFSVIFAGQDLPAFEKASKEEAASIGANTNIKICMKLEDPMGTWDFFAKTAGEAYVTKVDAFSTDASSLTNSYLDTRSASAEKRARIDLNDLKDQREGEAHFFFKSGIIRARTFFANPPPVPSMRLNHFLKVDKPLTRKLVNLEARLKQFEKIAEKGQELFADVEEQSEEVNFIAQSFEKESEETYIERSVSALIAFENRHQVAPEAVEEDVISDRLNVFVRIQLDDLVREAMNDEEFASFSAALLNKGFVREKTEVIERLTGKPANIASNVAQELVNDMDQATDYPPDVYQQPNVAAIVERGKKLIAAIKEQGSGGF